MKQHLDATITSFMCYKKIMDKLEAKKGQNMGKEFEVRKQSRKFQSFFIAYRKLNF